MSQKRRRKMRFTALALRVGFVCVVLYLAVMLVSTQVEIVARRQQLTNVTQEVDAQKAENLELQRTLDSDNEDAYIERVARDKLGYARPNERVFVDMSGK
ncbi:MAG: septum formation initiator family protein [Ruthenibacterium sp.]